MILNDLFVIAASSGSETPRWKKRIFGLILGAASLEFFIHLERHGRARLPRSRVPVPLRRRFAPVGSFRRGQRSVHNVYKNLHFDFDAGLWSMTPVHVYWEIHGTCWVYSWRGQGMDFGGKWCEEKCQQDHEVRIQICSALWFSIIQKCGRSGVTVVTPTSRDLGV